MSLSTDERTAICDDLDAAGPDRPTLCEGWTTRDLLAHLLMRERQPWALAGIAVPALAPVTDGAMRRYDAVGWSEMVGLLRSGPPRWSPFHIAKVDELANGVEFFVHHEDIRRGAPGWEPRPVDATRDGQLWASVGGLGRMLFRRAGVGIVLRRPSGEQRVVTTGPGLVTIVGEPGELVLYAFGRDAARVELVGDAADLATLAAAPRGA